MMVRLRSRIVTLGRVPYKVPKRIPIGAAIGIAGTFVTGNTAILERSAFKLLVYPELEPSGTRATQAGMQAGPAIGLLAALAAEGSLVALDKPDTRSWTFLPQRVALSRIPVEPGDHEVEVSIVGLGETRSIPVRVPEDGFAVVLVSVPR